MKEHEGARKRAEDAVAELDAGVAAAEEALAAAKTAVEEQAERVARSKSGKKRFEAEVRRITNHFSFALQLAYCTACAAAYRRLEAVLRATVDTSGTGDA